jgi:alkylation response protein AidB-like acyl-CoA dehydrogenase
VERRVRNAQGPLRARSRTFITDGINSDLVIAVARTDPDAGASGIIARDLTGLRA